jgi:hypothetical protein
LSVHGLLDHGKGCTRCGAVAFDPAFRELEQKRLGRRDTARGPALADSNHPTQDSLIGDFPVTIAGAACRIATPALGKPGLPRRLAIPDRIVFRIIRWTVR